jgi:uncharacterized protein
MSQEGTIAGEVVASHSGQTVQLLVLQATPFCNIDCSYCYLPARNRQDRMSDQVIAAACDRIVEAGRIGPAITVLWHAGEPLVLGPSYYENAIALIESRFPSSTVIRHAFQTNGTLIDEAWCRFFGRPNITIGISVDGPKNLHDLHRVTRKGARTFDKTAAGLRLLRDHGINLQVITVLTRHSLFFPDEIYDFYVSEGISRVCFNVEEIEGVNRKSTLTDARCDDLFERFLERFLARVARDRRIKSVREFDHAFAALLNPRPRDRQAEPFEFVSVATNGDFGTYSPELLGLKDARWSDFAFGNVLTDSFEEAAGTDKFIRMTEEINEGIARCRATCSFFDVCGGGAPVNKFCETGRFDATETLHCRLIVKCVTTVALRDFERNAPQGEGRRNGC